MLTLFGTAAGIYRKMALKEDLEVLHQRIDKREKESDAGDDRLSQRLDKLTEEVRSLHSDVSAVAVAVARVEALVTNGHGRRKR